MSNELYTAASSGLANLRKLEVIADNLANVNTVGFKSQRLVQREQSFADTLASSLSNNPPNAQRDIETFPGAVNVQTVTDFSSGPLEQTGNPLHAALQMPNHFFVVQGEDGQEYTRAGNFTLGPNGELYTQDGKAVLGQGGPIALPPGEVKILSEGTVLVNQQQVGRLQVVQVERPENLVRKAGTRFSDSGNAGTSPVDPLIVPGAVEMPNINPVQAMVEMISTQRAFEAYSATVRTIDDLSETTRRAAQQTGGG